VAVVLVVMVLVELVAQVALVVVVLETVQVMEQVERSTLVAVAEEAHLLTFTLLEAVVQESLSLLTLLSTRTSLQSAQA
jgi:hypothetical protein